MYRDTSEELQKMYHRWRVNIYIGQDVQKLKNIVNSVKNYSDRDLKWLGLQFLNIFRYFFFIFFLIFFVKIELSYACTINLFTTAKNCMEKWIILWKQVFFLLLVIIWAPPKFLDS